MWRLPGCSPEDILTARRHLVAVHQQHQHHHHRKLHHTAAAMIYNGINKDTLNKFINFSRNLNITFM